MSAPLTPPTPVVLDQHCRNSIPFELSTRGVPDNVTTVHAWRMLIFNPASAKSEPLKLYANVTGQAEYLAPDPDTGVKGYGRLTFVLEPADCSGKLWGVAEYVVQAVDADGVPECRFGGPITLSPKPLVA